MLGREVLSVTFHPALSKKIYDILREVQVIFQGDEEHKTLFSSIPLVSFRRAKTLQDILVRSKLPNEDRGKEFVRLVRVLIVRFVTHLK